MSGTPKLPKVFKRRWVAALRSGKYEQGKDILMFQNKFCCLGVAAKVCNAPEREIQKYTLIEDSGLVPYSVLNVLNAQKGPCSIQETLAQRNDNGWSFKRIASYIERYL